MVEQINADRVKAIREAMGLNRIQFARAVQVTRQTVTNWETGRTIVAGPALMLLHSIAEKYRA